MNKKLNVGNNIKNIRIDKGFMLKEVAEKCGISFIYAKSNRKRNR